MNILKDDLRILLESRFKDTNLSGRISITVRKIDNSLIESEIICSFITFNYLACNTKQSLI